MTTSGLFLSMDSFHALSPAAQKEIQSKLGLPAPTPSAKTPVPMASITSSPDEGPAELTVALVRRLTKKLGAKTTMALRVIAQSSTPEFHQKDVVEAIEGAETYQDVSNVWSALTRRTHSILDDPEADLIWWIGEGIYDEDEVYVDHVGRVSPLTHHSLRVHFGIE